VQLCAKCVPFARDLSGKCAQSGLFECCAIQVPLAERVSVGFTFPTVHGRDLVGRARQAAACESDWSHDGKEGGRGGRLKAVRDTAEPCREYELGIATPPIIWHGLSVLLLVFSSSKKISTV